MGRNSVQAVGNSTYTYQHPLINGGVPVNLINFKLEMEYINAKMLVPNSKVVLLVDGSAITLTNTARAGEVTTSCADAGGIPDGNPVAIARELQQLGDSVGGSLRIAQLRDGVVFALTLLFVTFKTGPLLTIAGNDIPTYPLEWCFQDWKYS